MKPAACSRCSQNIDSNASFVLQEYNDENNHPISDMVDDQSVCSDTLILRNESDDDDSFCSVVVDEAKELFTDGADKENDFCFFEHTIDREKSYWQSLPLMRKRDRVVRFKKQNIFRTQVGRRCTRPVVAVMIEEKCIGSRICLLKEDSLGQIEVTEQC